MIYLLLSILFSSLIQLIFSWFKSRSIDNFPAIRWNYFTCAILAIITGANPGNGIHENWLPLVLCTGTLFIVVFMGMARVTQEFGVSVSAVSSKMAVIFPVLLGVLVIGEQLTILKIAGIILSMISVLLMVSNDEKKKEGTHWLIPLMVWIGSGLIDVILKYLDWQYPSSSAQDISFFLFGTAFITGTIYWLIQKKKSDGHSFFHGFVPGLMLGLPNYFSIYFLLKAIANPSMDASYLFPVNNTGVVLLSSLLALVIFKQHLSLRKIMGIVLAVLAIILLS